MSAASPSPPGDGRPFDADLDLPALGATLWRKKWKILLPDDSGRADHADRRPSHHAAISVGVARLH